MTEAPWVTLAELSRDPYPLYARLRREAPVAFVPELDLWLVTRDADVRAALLGGPGLATGGPHSLIAGTFGENMLTVEGADHRRYRDAKTQAAFMPRPVAACMEARVVARVRALVGGFARDGAVELRAALASRLPVLAMLDMFGLPDGDEPVFRRWYDAFEAALANHGRDPAVKVRAAAAVDAFHGHFQKRIELARDAPGDTMLDAWLARGAAGGLDDAAIRRNALIVLFGGISTVEALILNSLWALLTHPEEGAAAIADASWLDAVLDETMRWLSPVQSATRHVVADTAIAGVAIPTGATVNLMLGAANRDPAAWEEADRFAPGRANAGRHLGFAAGPHHCLGQHLARLEARAAIGALLALPDLRLARPAAVTGHEFRQPRALHLAWTVQEPSR